MVIIDVFWQPTVNVVLINCDCQQYFLWPSNISLAECPYCRNKEWWFKHEPADPFPGFKTAVIKLRSLQ